MIRIHWDHEPARNAGFSRLHGDASLPTKVGVPLKNRPPAIAGLGVTRFRASGFEWQKI
jgi:hypothetical protein